MKIRTEAGQFVCETAQAWGWSEKTGIYALARTVNALAAAGAECMGVEAVITYPPYRDRAGAYAAERCIRRTCRERGIDLTGTKIRQNPLYNIPMVSISGIGYHPADGAAACGKQSKDSLPGAHTGALPEDKLSNVAGWEIILVKWAGMEGMLHVADEKEDELRQRFAPAFMNQIRSYQDEIFAGKELEIAEEAGVSVIRQITEGGILAALWELAKETGMGMEAEMRQIPVLQETIEVCEHYRLNPYQMTSAGSFLMAAKDGGGLASMMERAGIRASVIGRLTAGNDKILRNGEDIRYIDRPAPDDLYKIWSMAEPQEKQTESPLSKI